MNINALLGTITFVLWSSFSVWFYVNNIYEFDNVKVASATEIKLSETVAVNAVAADIKEVANEVMIKEEIKAEATAPAVVKSETKVVAKATAINITKDFNFDKNSDQVKNAQELEAFINELKSSVTDRKVQIQIVGYTCDLGTDQYNQKLGLKRAESVAKALGALALDSTALKIETKGEQSPVVPNDTESNRTKNRRVTVIFSATI